MSVFKKPNDISPSNKIINSSDNDIMYLLNLEILKRFKDDEVNIRRQIEEQERQYQELLTQYHVVYSRYVKLIKLGKVRGALEQSNHLHSDLIEVSKRNIAVIKTTTNRSVIDVLDYDTLEQFHQSLALCKDYTKLKKIQCDIMNNIEIVKAIQSSHENIETQLDTAVFQGTDYFVDEFNF